MQSFIIGKIQDYLINFPKSNRQDEAIKFRKDFLQGEGRNLKQEDDRGCLDRGRRTLAKSIKIDPKRMYRLYFQNESDIV
jgi:hypothetical protein